MQIKLTSISYNQRSNHTDFVDINQVYAVKKKNKKKRKDLLKQNFFYKEKIIFKKDWH